MIKVIGLLLLGFISLIASANEVNYQALGQPNITIDIENKVYLIGDAKGVLLTCQFVSVKMCFKIENSFIVVPENYEAPLKRRLSTSLELVFLPIVKSMSILGKRIDGFEVYIHNLEDNSMHSSVFFNNEQGILMFRVNGNTYWSSNIKGVRIF